MVGRICTRILAVAMLATVVGCVSAVSGPAAAAPVAAAPPHGMAESLAFTHSRHDLTLIAAGVILLLIVVLLLRITRRRQTDATSSVDGTQRTFPPSADTWHNADLAKESTAPLPSFHQSEVVLPTAAPGWHPVQGDQTKLAYWDGTQWAAYRHWDGTQWVDPAGVHQ
jgi:hypothetical protein